MADGIILEEQPKKEEDLRSEKADNCMIKKAIDTRGLDEISVFIFIPIMS